MAWGGGTYTKPYTWTAGTPILASDHNAQDTDFTNGINNCLAKDGQNAMTGNLSLGGNILTNVGAGSAAAPAFSPGADADTGMFLAGTNALGVATGGVERIRVTAAGEVGVAATPGAGIPFQVKGGTANAGGHSGVSGFFAADTGAAQNAGVILGSNNGTEPYVAASKLGNGTDTPLAFYTATTEKARILPNGNFGVGTTNPTAKLQVDGTVLVNANSAGEAFRITQTGAGKAFVVEDSANPDTSPFVIANNGQVGVGISDPTAVSSKLYVNGELYGTDVTAETVVATTIVKSAGVTLSPEYVGGAFSTLPNASATTGVIRGSHSDGTVSNAGGGTLSIAGGKATGNAAGGPIIFSTSVAGASGTTVQSLAERMRIGTDGSVTLNSATPVFNVGSSNTSTQDCTLRIGANRTGDGASAIEMATDTTHGLAGLQITRSAGSNATTTISHKGTGGLLLNCRDAAALAFRTQDIERMRVTSGGNVGIGTTGPSYQLQLSTDSAAKPTTNTWTIASDARIKTNIAPYQKGLTEIRQVEPISYDYNGKGGIPQGPGGVSIIAQDLQPIFPECVGSYRAKLGEADEEETDILNYNGHAITFALINAVKELADKVDRLEAQLAAMEAP